MNKNFAIVFFVSAVWLGTTWVSAQETAPSRPSTERGPSSGLGGGMGGFTFFAPTAPTVTLLRTPEVRTELTLDEDKAKKVDEINAEIIRERTRLNAEYNAKIAELNKKADTDALALLNDAQRRRTEQIRLQQQGLRALSTDAVAEKLGLTKAQRDEIAKLVERTPFSLRERGPSNAPPSGRFQERLQESNRRASETREKLLAVLTPDQKAKWSELTGEPFQFPSRWGSSTRGTSTRSSEPAKPDAEKKDQ